MLSMKKTNSRSLACGLAWVGAVVRLLLEKRRAARLAVQVPTLRWRFADTAREEFGVFEHGRTDFPISEPGRQVVGSLLQAILPEIGGDDAGSPRSDRLTGKKPHRSQTYNENDIPGHDGGTLQVSKHAGQRLHVDRFLVRE